MQTARGLGHSAVADAGDSQTLRSIQETSLSQDTDSLQPASVIVPRSGWLDLMRRDGHRLGWTLVSIDSRVLSLGQAGGVLLA